jgi:hypothetical protein
MKITKLNLSKSCTIQIEQYNPVTSFYAVEISLEEGDNLEELKKKYDENLDKWIEFSRLKWSNPSRAITAGRKLGVYDPLPKKDKPPF